MSTGTMVENLGIRFTEAGDDHLIGMMPVDERTRQPMGLLHGGASAALAETLGSVASFLCLTPDSGKMPVGINLHVNHLNSVFSGFVTGKVTPVKLGRTLHIWQILIFDETKKPVCSGTLSVLIKIL